MYALIQPYQEYRGYINSRKLDMRVPLTAEAYHTGIIF